MSLQFQQLTFSYASSATSHAESQWLTLSCGPLCSTLRWVLSVNPHSDPECFVLIPQAEHRGSGLSRVYYTGCLTLVDFPHQPAVSLQPTHQQAIINTLISLQSFSWPSFILQVFTEYLLCARNYTGHSRKQKTDQLLPPGRMKTDQQMSNGNSNKHWKGTAIARKGVMMC